MELGLGCLSRLVEVIHRNSGSTFSKSSAESEHWRHPAAKNNEAAVAATARDRSHQAVGLTASSIEEFESSYHNRYRNKTIEPLSGSLPELQYHSVWVATYRDSIHQGKG